MPNKCVAFGCTTGYDKKKTEAVCCDKGIATFHFPFKDEKLLEKWTRFVNKQDWKPTATTVLCEKHFKEDLVKHGKRTTLNWNLDPIPTIQSPAAMKRPASFPIMTEIRKPPKIRNIYPDQLKSFTNSDVIKSLSDIDPIRDCPPGFQGKRNYSSVLFYRTDFDGKTGFPSISAGILVDENLHVKLQCNGVPIPLPKWFITGTDARLTRHSMLENFPSFIANHAQTHPSFILDELRRRQQYKPNGRPPFSPELLRYSLLLRYTSPQAYRLLQKEFPLPSFTLLQSLHRGGVNALKAAKTLLQEGTISSDVILMSDEMYLQKSTQYHGGKYIGSNSDGELFSGIVVFMVVGLKKSVPIVVRAVPETSINGE